MGATGEIAREIDCIEEGFPLALRPQRRNDQRQSFDRDSRSWLDEGDLGPRQGSGVLTRATGQHLLEDDKAIGRGASTARSNEANQRSCCIRFVGQSRSQ